MWGCAGLRQVMMCKYSYAVQLLVMGNKSMMAMFQF